MYYLSPVSRVEAQWTFAELIMGSTSRIIKVTIDMVQFPMNTKA